MKLFVYYNNFNKASSIHAYAGNDWKEEISDNYLCGAIYHYKIDYKSYLDTTKPFCKKCNKLLKKKGIDMKQLAINQKLGVR